jgi:hypothetical protein
MPGRRGGGGGSGTVVVDIPGVQRASARLGEAAQAYELAARICSRPLPSTPEWGARNEVTILHIPEGQQGWALSGTVGPQPEFGPEFVGGAQQHLLHTLSTSNALWSGPFPWEKIPNLGYALQGAGRVGTVGLGTALPTHPAAVGGLP